MLPLELIYSELAICRTQLVSSMAAIFLGHGYNFLIWGPPSFTFHWTSGKLAPASFLISPYCSPPHPPISVSVPSVLSQLVCRPHGVPQELSPSDLVTVVRVYGGELHCPLFHLAKQQIKASSGSIFNPQPLSKAYAPSPAGHQNCLGF